MTKAVLVNNTNTSPVKAVIKKKAAEKKEKVECVGKPDLPVHDVDSKVQSLAGTDADELMKSVGMPDDIEFEDYQKSWYEDQGTLMKEAELPAWCWMMDGDAAKKKDRRMQISFDGKTISTRLLSKKKNLLETEIAFGKRVGRTKWDPKLWDSGEVTWKVTEACVQKMAVLLHACPFEVNGSGGQKA